MVDKKMIENLDDTAVRNEIDINVCPLSDNYFSKCPVMRTYYYLVEEFFASWSWSG